MADYNDYNGLYASEGKGINIKSTLEDFMKKEYVEGLRNEFASCDALLNSLSKDTITGKKKYKTFRLGITDNIRSLGKGGKSDLYQVGMSDFIKAPNTVDAEFDTTKLIGVFSITDETLLKGRGDGTLFDVLSETLNAMQLGLSNTMNRYTYGSKNGGIGAILSAELITFSNEATDPSNPGEMCGNAAITNNILKVKAKNSSAILPGLGVMIDVQTAASTHKYRQGVIWQKDDTSTFGEDFLYIILDEANSSNKDEITDTELGTVFTSLSETGAYVAASGSDAAKNGAMLYARQFAQGAPVQEYTGLQDIVVDNANVFGVRRDIFTSLRCLQKDMYDATNSKNGMLTESALRDMADRIQLVTPEGANVNLVCAKHGIISCIEKQMYQFKQYSLDTAGNGFTLGRPNIKFDTFELKKDRFAHDNTVYLLDTTKIGELVRKEFDWITSGREGILERRDGTEVYEAIMTKYADMYIDAWKAHASFINVADSYSA